MAYVQRGVTRWWLSRILEKPKYPLPAMYYRPPVLNRPPSYEGPPTEEPPSYNVLYPQGARAPSRTSGNAEESSGARPRTHGSGRRRRRGNRAEESPGTRAQPSAGGHIPLRYNTDSTLFSDDPPSYIPEYERADYIYATQAVAAALAVSTLPGVAQARLATWHGPLVRLADVIVDYSTEIAAARHAPDYEQPPSYSAAVSHDRQSVRHALDSPPAEQTKDAAAGAMEDQVITLTPPVLRGATAARPTLEPVPEEDELDLPLQEIKL